MALTRQAGTDRIPLPTLSPHVGNGENWAGGEDGDHNGAKNPTVFEDITGSSLVPALDTEIDHEIYRHDPSDHQTSQAPRYQVHEPSAELTLRHSVQPSRTPLFTTSTSHEAR